MTYRILLSGGGTAGSVTPLVALAEQIRRQRHDVEFRFIGTADGPEKVLAQAANIPFETIASGKLRRYWSWKNFSDLGRLWRGYKQAQSIIRSWRPQVAISAGSFVSVPVIWAAHRSGVATLVHQQDVRPGLANRLMAPAADIITVSFKSSAQAFAGRRTKWIGNPVRPEVLAGDKHKARQLFQLPEKRPVLLILGGGTGSSAINTMIGTMAYKLAKQWSIMHVTGPDRDFMELHDEHYQRFPFLTWQLPHAMAVADVVVSRAGLGSLSELAALSKAAIFIPLPGSHQEENARIITESMAGIVLDQRVSIESRLAEALERLRLDQPERQQLGNNLHQLYNPDALPQFVDEVLHLLKT
jgi:UDP-N-acetylglucosamine--N-acetylmuramyl-(pentapeptide) pyrophosphoryl-undecaprenol N-acetylglucosamine transferase